jgi:hypothetical protein
MVRGSFLVLFAWLGGLVLVSALRPMVAPLVAQPPLPARAAPADVFSSSNNLKFILIALHNYHDVKGSFPPPAIPDKNGKPLLSWRVAILPYVEQEALYREFKLDEPWDSEHNKKLIGRMPKIYATPGDNKDDIRAGRTRYRVFVGRGAAWEMNNLFTFRNFTDGTANTWMVVVAKEAVPWTKPEELPFDPKKNMADLLGTVGGVWQAGFADGHVENYPKLPKAETINALITRDGGEVINDR